METRPIQVLILEDREADAELMVYELHQAGFDPNWQRIDSETDFLTSLDASPDLILADHSMPQFDAHDALRHLRERGLDIPLIAVTGTMDDEMAVKYMKEGAADYLLKDRLARLGPAVKQVLKQKALRAQKQKADEALRESEVRYRRLVELSPDGIAVYSKEQLVFINTAGVKLLGADCPEELLERPLLDLVHPNSRDVFRQQIQQSETGAAAPPIEEKFIRLDGTALDVEVKVAPFVHKGLPAVQVVFRDITERKLAEKAIQWQLKNLTALHGVATAGAEATSVDELIERISQIIGQTVDSDNFSVGLVDKEANLLRLYRSYRRISDQPGRDSIPLGRGIVGQVVATGEPKRIPDVSQEPAYVEFYPGVSSELCVPLKVGEEVIGVINAESIQLNAFSEADELLLMTIAGQLATAIDRIRLFETTRRRAEELEVLAVVSSALRKAPTRVNMLPVILDLLLNLLAVDGAALVLRDPDTDEAVVELGRGTATALTGVRLPPGEGISGHVIKTGQPYVTFKVQEDGLFPFADLFNHSQAVGSVPLVAHEETVGALWVSRNAPIATEEVRLLGAIGDVAANAIHRATLYEEAERHVQRLTALRSIVLAITASPDLNRTLKVLLEQVTQQLAIDAVDILLLNQQTQKLEYAAAQGFYTDAVMHTCLELGEEYAGRAALEGQIVHVPDLAASTNLVRTEMITNEKFVCYYAVPLITKGEVEGVLEIFSRASLDPDAEWLSFLEALATQAAIAIENARLFTETERLLKQTQEQAQQVQQIMDTVPEGMLLLDAHCRVVLANPTGRKYLAQLGDAEVGDTLSHLGGRAIEELLQDDLPNGLRYELERGGPPHQIFEVEAQVVQTGPYAGGWVLVIRDVTQAREMQERAQQQERLAAVGQLAAGIAHDFNNILTGIIGFAELARLQPEAWESQQEFLEPIVNQGKRAAQLVRQVLDFSRQTEAETQLLNPTPLIMESVKLLERLIPESIRISVEIESSCNSCLINANPTQIQQVLTNLAVNARDAMPDGGYLCFKSSCVTISPGAKSLSLDLIPGEWLVLSISDTGVGLSPEAQPRIFEPFYTTKEVGKGTGLGLAQVYGIVKQHGGDIEVESQVGQGTTFTLYLPISASPKTASPSVVTKETPTGNGEVILLVEDDSAVLDIVQRLLTTLSYRVLTARDGQMALEVYEKHRDEIDLVLTDVTMPRMSGVALLQNLRKRDPHIKAIAMTGYSAEAITKGLLSQGFAVQLQKPLVLRNVGRIIREVLNSRRPEAE